MRKVILLPILLLMFSCYLFKENGIDFKIINRSKHSVSNIILKTSENTDSIVIPILKPDESNSGFLKMVNAKTDGSYIINYDNENGETIESGAGYYTNGSSLDRWIRFEIMEDTTLISLGDYP